MASPSTWRWSWRTTSDSSLTVSSSSSSCSPSTFSFSLYRRNQTSRTPSYRTKFSLDHNSSSSSDNKVLKKIKSIQVQKSVDPNSLLIGIEEISESDKKSTTLILDEKILKKGYRFKSLFGKKPLWKRIFFASKKVRSIMLLNVVALIYASNIPVVKEVEAVMDPATFTVVRFALSAIPFVPFVLRASGDVQTRNAGLELGIWVSLGYLMQALGLLTSDAGRASFISLFTVIIVPLLDGMLGAEVPALTWFGALMSVLGVTLLESSGSPPSVGDLLNFLSAVFFGVHMLRTEHISRSTKRENFLPLLGYEVCVVAIFSILWYFMGEWFGGQHGWDPGSWTWEMVWDWTVKFPWIPAFYTGIFSTGVCLWVEMTAMRDVSATEAAIIYGLEPLWGAGFAWFLLGERWGVTGWIGAALVLGGSLTVQIFGSSPPSKIRKTEDDSERRENLLVSDKRKGFSASPVVITTRKKDVSDLFKNMTDSVPNGRPREWTTDEDMCLCKAVKYESIDGVIVSHGLPSDLYWNDINTVFSLLSNHNYIRRGSELAERFEVIVDNVTEYVNVLRDIYAELSPDSSIRTVEIQGRKNYEFEYNKPWGYAHCFEVLRELNQFNPTY